MKPQFEKIPQKLQKSFTARNIVRDSRPLLSQAWHFHPEIEICYTSKSQGKRFVGNKISDYKEHDLVIFGGNLPHGFTTEMQCKQVVIQFSPGFLGREFFQSPELNEVSWLVDHSRRGLEFVGDTKIKAIKIINKLIKAEGFEQMIRLFELLHVLSMSDEYIEICSDEYAHTLSEMNLSRVKQVYDYIILNYTKMVSVREVAEMLSLTEAAFYKFIKKHTQKTFIEIVNEFRINHACDMLMSSDKTISEVCYESGFNNVSYFNRKFKEIMKQSPKGFKLSYLDSH